MASRSHLTLRLLSLAVLSFYTSLATAVSGQEPLKAEKTQYRYGDKVPVTCLNRTVETGEHITDLSTGALQYIPFPVCNETGQPLSLTYGLSQNLTCTIDFVSDSFFHLLEFYVHNDAPLTCRIPTRPMSTSFKTKDSSSFSVATGEDGDETSIKGLGNELGHDNTLYTPLVVAMAGTLQLSHLHVSNDLNLLLHISPQAPKTAATPGNAITAAASYSISPHSHTQRVKIGDSLPLHFSVRWYPYETLPSSKKGFGGHIFMSTIVYCLFSAMAGVGLATVWFRGFVLPRRLRTYMVRDKGVLPTNMKGGYGFPGGGAMGNGFGNGGLGATGGGVGAGYGYAYGGTSGGGGYGYGVGKRD